MKKYNETYFLAEEEIQEVYFKEVDIDTENFEEVYFKIEIESEYIPY
jgi:hypothetical protein